MELDALANLESNRSVIWVGPGGRKMGLNVAVVVAPGQRVEDVGRRVRDSNPDLDARVEMGDLGSLNHGHAAAGRCGSLPGWCQSRYGGARGRNVRHRGRVR